MRIAVLAALLVVAPSCGDRKGSVEPQRTAVPVPPEVHAPAEMKDRPKSRKPQRAAANNLLPPDVKSPTEMTGRSMVANWESSTGAQGYRLDVSPDAAFETFLPGYENLDTGASMNQPVTGLQPNTLYHYRVRAYNAAGISANSGVATTPTEPRKSAQITSQ